VGATVGFVTGEGSCLPGTTVILSHFRQWILYKLSK
jgi:hypothetical protein